MPLMACSPNLRTHFRHLSDFAAVVVFLVLIVYVFLIVVAVMVFAFLVLIVYVLLIAVAVMVVGFVLVVLAAVAGDRGRGSDTRPRNNSVELPESRLSPSNDKCSSVHRCDENCFKIACQ